MSWVEKHFAYREEKKKIEMNFLSETMKARREWNEVFEVKLEQLMIIKYIVLPKKLSFVLISYFCYN